MGSFHEWYKIDDLWQINNFLTNAASGIEKKDLEIDTLGKMCAKTSYIGVRGRIRNIFLYTSNSC